MTAPGQGQHQHAEAYALMRYASDDGTKAVLVWNSRDGVTPFVISIDGIQYTHTNWGGDTYAPDHDPHEGDWVFVDLTEGRARELAAVMVDRYLADDHLGKQLRARYSGRDAAVRDLAQDALKPGAPDLIRWPATEECRSCNAPILWCQPLDPAKSSNPVQLTYVGRPGGNLVVWQAEGTGVWMFRYLRKADRDVPLAAGEQLAISHYAKCPQADEWRGRRGR